MVGNEIAVGLFVHPQLWKLSKENHIKFVQPFAKISGKIMPFWYLITLLSSALLTYILSNKENLSGFWLGLTASVLWLLSIIYTIVALVPINNSVATWNMDNLPEDWEKQRHTWDSLHQIRIVLLVIGFIFLILAVLKGFSV